MTKFCINQHKQQKGKCGNLFDFGNLWSFSATLKPHRAQIVCKLEVILYLNVASAVKLGKKSVFCPFERSKSNFFGQNRVRGHAFYQQKYHKNCQNGHFPIFDVHDPLKRGQKFQK